ncbi:Nif3-like dinuclear metal center hexameric protein [Spirochaeta cellobiosiphila]|uniref:Nif3-like dinuclear metal center hexameric protein n=1 Tax=Spirochaeta cellobiosiphila TaxID=504483 RepID=UPI0003F64A17|nr:Nif3-like dinuclear metal center hexameric protein [Spirochaeta cellobiosiphila]
MLLKELDKWIQDQFPGSASLKDMAINGLQVDRQNQDINKIAFAVDACMETFERAHQQGADMLFVHHGLYWGFPMAITGRHYKRIQYLIDKELALYAMHLPLDVHPELGNNAVITKVLGLTNVQSFGYYKGQAIGLQGEFPHERTLDEIVESLFGGYDNTIKVLPFGKKNIKTMAVVTGSGGSEAREALSKNLDLYITGDASHILYHDCQEGGMNVIFGGHYATEIWGVQFVAKKIATELGLATVYIDVPTGL